MLVYTTSKFILIYYNPLKYNLVSNFIYFPYWLRVYFAESNNTVIVSFSVN